MCLLYAGNTSGVNYPHTFFSALTPVAGSINMHGFTPCMGGSISFFYLLLFFVYDIMPAAPTARRLCNHRANGYRLQPEERTGIKVKFQRDGATNNNLVTVHCKENKIVTGETLDRLAEAWSGHVIIVPCFSCVGQLKNLCLCIRAPIMEDAC